MPSATDFRRGFRLEQGRPLGTSNEWKIASLHVGHAVKEQNEQYEFPTELTLEWLPGTAATGGREQAARRRRLEAAWREAVRSEHIVHSAYGSPYECTYCTSPSVSCLNENGLSWRLTSLGRAVRRRDIPTLGQQAAEEREEHGVREVTKEEERRYLDGYRVIKSRFGTSKCSICSEGITQGIKICKEKGNASKGGWAHATCILQHKIGKPGDVPKEEGGSDGKEQVQEEGQQERGPGRKRKVAARTGGKRSRKLRHGGDSPKAARGRSLRDRKVSAAGSGGGGGQKRRHAEAEE